MPTWLSILVGTVVALIVLWLVLVLILWVQSHRLGRRVSLREVLRLIPDVIGMVRRLAHDRSLPRRVRWMVYGLLTYLLFPIDLVPDFIPVLGYADDAVVVLLVLRYVLRAAGTEAVSRHWRGTTEGLNSVLQLAGSS